MFIGAALGIALSHLPGLSMIAGTGIGIGAMTVAMLGMPLTAVLLPTLLLQADGVQLMPLVIVAVAVSYVVSARLEPAAASTAGASTGSSDAPDASAPGAAPEETDGRVPVATGATGTLG